MSTEKTLIISNGIGQSEMVKGLLEKWWKVIKNTAWCVVLVLLGVELNAQANNWVWFINTLPQLEPWQTLEIIIDQNGWWQVDVVQDNVEWTFNANLERWVFISWNRVLASSTMNNWLVTWIEWDKMIARWIVTTWNNPCWNESWEDNFVWEDGASNEIDKMVCVMTQILPIKRSSISSYVKDAELRVDAKSEQAVNVDYVDMEVSADGNNFMVEDTEKAINGNAPKTYNFSASVDELIRKYNIVRPTVFYTRLTNHDFDGKTQTSDVQAVEISPDGTVTPLKVLPNIAQNAEQIKFVIGWDAETLYPIRLINLASWTIVTGKETFIAGSTEHTLSDVISTQTLSAGNYVIQIMWLWNNGVVTQRFVITP
jgi:hypothetical protein